MAARRHMPLSVKLDAALNALGLLGIDVEWDHNPPLGLRERDPVTGRYTPDENDPRYIEPMVKQAHREKTVGHPATCADGDIHKIAKARRLEREMEEFRARLLERPRKDDRPKNKWPKRKMESRGSAR